MANPVSTERTLQDLRRVFRLWDDPLYEVIYNEKDRRSIAVRYLRDNVWQEVRCSEFHTRGENLRQCFLLLERLSKAERHGVQYSGLTSSTALTTASPDVKKRESLLEAYMTLGASPDDPIELIKKVYLQKAQFYHPDKGAGDDTKFKGLQAAYETICESRGVKP